MAKKKRKIRSRRTVRNLDLTIQQPKLQYWFEVRSDGFFRIFRSRNTLPHSEITLFGPYGRFDGAMKDLLMCLSIKEKVIKNFITLAKKVEKDDV